MNYMPKVLEMLGVGVEEKFNIDSLIDNPYYFDDDYVLVDKNDNNVIDTVIMRILTGGHEIEKIPWKPKDNEWYICVSVKGIIINSMWISSAVDFYRYNAGNVFRQNEEITDEIKQRILQEMKGPYDND